MRTFMAVLILFLIAGLIPPVTCAQVSGSDVEGHKTGEVRCEELVFCAGIKDRAPVGASETFPRDVFKVYCFTTIAGVEDTLAITHEWYYGDKKVATVDLPVKSSRWRTWSSKKMMPGWQGAWRVDVRTPEGAVIRSGSFTLE